jgi:hypothetical protein
VKFGRKPKMTPQQIAHARKLIDQGEDRQSDGLAVSPAHDLPLNVA